jgi:hypothetical protein
MIDKSGLVKLLRLFAATIESLDQQQIDQLMAGKGRLMFTAARVKDTSTAQPIEHGAILAKLNSCKERDEARKILSAITGRDALASFAKALKVHVIKHDRREDIESKIIEFVIGGKLRTEAIQSLDLKGGGEGHPSDKG